MVVHMIYDFTFLYYKYKFAIKNGNLKRLTCAVDWKGSVIEKDISIVYYCIREIEQQRRELEQQGYSVVSSVCFDMPSTRKDLDGGEEYKAGRTNKLEQEDFDNIQFIEKILSEAGHNTYRYDGYEADDLVTYLATNYKDIFDFTIIYTPDKDLFVNIDKKVGIKRHKVGQGYFGVTTNNYSQYLSDEFGCTIPYNSILLFLCTVGDKADHVKGINKFGPKAFDKLVKNLDTKEIDWNKCNDAKYLEDEVLQAATEFLKPEQAQEMINSYMLIKPKEVEVILHAPDSKVTYEKRMEAYGKYNFTSLLQ